MKSLYLKDLLPEIGGCIVQGGMDCLINNVPIHLSYLKKNSLYFNREKMKITDCEVLKNAGTCAIVIQDAGELPHVPKNITIVKVDDINNSYWSFVRFYRGLYRIPVIGVTGTCGKTTTKEMIKFILSEQFKVYSTYKSKNALQLNIQYLTGIDESTEAAVFEMGVAYPGNLLNSCRHFKPSIGIITNIGIDHLQGCKTLENYIKAKAEILEGLGNKGTLILNADDINTRKIDLTLFKGNILYFGLNESSDYRAVDIKYGENGMEFTLAYQNRRYRLFVPGYGEHNVYNALAAIAACHMAGLGVKQAGERLGSFDQVERHLQLHRGMKGSRIINDTWSSNPTSTEAALKVLKGISGSKKSIAVIGRMALLGEHADEQYLNIGKKAAELGIDALIVLGTEVEAAARGAVEGGMDREKVYICTESEEALKVLESLVNSNSVVLVKTSMEDYYGKFVDRLICQ